MRPIRGRNNKQPVLKAEVTVFITGIVRTVYTQEKIVIAAAESDLRHQSQTVDTAFRQPPLMDDFGPCADNEENCLGVLDGTIVLHPESDPLLFCYWKRWCNYNPYETKAQSAVFPAPKKIQRLDTNKRI